MMIDHWIIQVTFCLIGETLCWSWVVAPPVTAVCVSCYWHSRRSKPKVKSKNTFENLGKRTWRRVGFLVENGASVAQVDSVASVVQVRSTYFNHYEPISFNHHNIFGLRRQISKANFGIFLGQQGKNFQNLGRESLLRIVLGWKWV